MITKHKMLKKTSVHLPKYMCYTLKPKFFSSVQTDLDDCVSGLLRSPITGHQFKTGVWYMCTKPLKLCWAGFHVPLKSHESMRQHRKNYIALVAVAGQKVEDPNYWDGKSAYQYMYIIGYMMTPDHFEQYTMRKLRSAFKKELAAFKEKFHLMVEE